MSRVLLVGAHGKVARLALPLLVEAGHEVVGVVRNPDHTGNVAATGASAMVADVEHLSTDELVDVLAGQDVIVWTAGAGGGSPERTYAVDRDAAVRTVDAAVRAGVGRYVMVSYFGAGPDHGVAPDSSFFAYAEAKSAADAYLAATELGWTILRPSGLTDDPGTGRIESGDGVMSSDVPRADVAAVIAAVVDAPGSTAGRTLAFNRGEEPIAAVVGTTAAR